MGIKNKINELYLKSLKNRDSKTVDFIRYLKSQIKNKEIDEQEELKEEGLFSIIQKNIKKTEESLEVYKQQNREDLIKSATKEISILKSLLPEELSDQEIVSIINEIIETENIEKNIKSMGIIMKKVLSKTGARASAKKVSEIVKTILS